MLDSNNIVLIVLRFTTQFGKSKIIATLGITIGHQLVVFT